MAEDTRSTKDRFVEESIGMIKESLRVNRDTKGFGNIMKETFSPANFFGADSKMGKMFSSTEERDRIRGYGGGKQKGSANTSQEVGASPELKQIQADVAGIKDIQEENKSDPEFRELDKSGKDQLSVSKKILATLQNQEPAMTKMQGDSVIALLKKGVGVGSGGGGEESDSGSGFFSGALATGAMMKGKDLFAAGKNKAGSLMKGAKSAGGSLLRGAGGVARGLGGAGLGVGLGAYEAVSGAMGAERDLEGLEISAEEAQSRKGEAIGSGAGGAGGALAGAAAGAAVGSVVPVVGTFIGGLVGGAIGYFAGSAAGGAAGEAIADAIPVSEEDLNESNQLANDYLDSISEKEGGSELVTKIKAEATEIESKLMEATGKQPEELSENDIEAIANAALIKSIQNNEEEAVAIAGYSASEQQNMMGALEDTASGSAGGPKVGDVVSMEKIRALANKDGGLGYAPALDEDGDEIPGQYEITRLGNSKRGLEIPDGQITSTGKRENFLQDYDKAKQNQETAEQKLADFEAEFGAPDTKETRSFGLAGDVEFDVYSDPELQARAEELRKAANVAKNERNALLNKEKKRTGGSEKDKFRAIQKSTGMSEDEVLATIGGERTEDGRAYSQGKLDALFTAQTEQNLSEETKSLQDRKMSAEIDNSLEQEVAEIDNSLNQELSDAVIADNAMRELTPKELQEQAEINADIEAGYREGLSGNTNASVVENATDDANNATAPGATAPVVVQAPAPAPQPQPDINVVVAMPKTIGPETRSGVRMIGMLGNDY